MYLIGYSRVSVEVFCGLYFGIVYMAFKHLTGTGAPAIRHGFIDGALTDIIIF